MLEELKEEEIVNKVGGRFKLSTLIQKRMIALNQGRRPLVDVRSATRWRS
jgi:DNA-directed RNA polymerase subunit omega